MGIPDQPSGKSGTGYEKYTPWNKDLKTIETNDKTQNALNSSSKL